MGVVLCSHQPWAPWKMLPNCKDTNIIRIILYLSTYPSIHPSILSSIHLSFFKWPEAKDLKTRRKREKENLFLHWISNLNKKLSLKSVIKDQSKQITNQKEHKWYLEVANGNVTRKARWSFLPLNRLREKDKNIMKTESFEDMMRKGGMLQKLEAIQK